MHKADAQTFTAAEIRRLLPDERDRILAAAVDLAVHDYVSDRELTAFEAFGRDDLHD